MLCNNAQEFIWLECRIRSGYFGRSIRGPRNTLDQMAALAHQRGGQEAFEFWLARRLLEMQPYQVAPEVIIEHANWCMQGKAPPDGAFAAIPAGGGEPAAMFSSQAEATAWAQEVGGMAVMQRCEGEWTPIRQMAGPPAPRRN